MRLSNRSQDMKTSPIRKLIPYSNKAKERGINIYHLNIGQPDTFVPDEFFESISNYRKRQLGYESSNGNADLIKANINYYKKNNIYFEENELFITNGGSEALNFAFFSICNEGDNILVFEPYYANYNSLGKISGIEFNAVTTSIENGFHMPTKDDIIAKIDIKTKAILISNPSNPTGCVYLKEELELLADIAIEYDLWIISDEVYREFVYDDIEYISFASINRVKDRVILIDSISKRYSACGARIGSIASKNKELNNQLLKLCQSRLSVATLEQIGATHLYGIDDKYIIDINKKYKRRRDLVVNRLNDIEGIITNTPEGAFYIIAKLPVENAEDFCIWLLKEFNYNNETIMLCPAKDFYKSEEYGKKEVRITYVLDEEKLKRSIDILEKALYLYRK